MFRNSLFTRPALALLFVLISAGDRQNVLSPVAMGQSPDRLTEKPVAIGYAVDLREERIFGYINSLAKRLDISLEEGWEEFEPEESEPSPEPHVDGVAWYLVQGLVPDNDFITFWDADRKDEATRSLKTQAKEYDAEFKDFGNDCFRIVRNWSHEFEPEEITAQEYVDRHQDAMEAAVDQTIALSVIEKDGTPMVKQTTYHRNLYRFHDNMMFNGYRDQLFDLQLPSRAELMQGARDGMALGGDAYFDRIPQGTKTLGWNLLNATAGTMMQQQDNEDAAEAAVRSTSIQFGLGIVKAVMFDLQEGHAWVRLANEEDQSIRGQLLLETKRNADLQKLLETASSGTSRFAPILKDDAFATFHSCVKLPEVSPVFKALSVWIPQFVAKERSSDAELVQAAQKVAITFADLADAETLEVLLKGGWSEESNGVFYGGVQVGHNEELLSALATFLKAAAGTDFGPINLTEVDDLPVLHFSIPADIQKALSDMLRLNLTDIYVAHGASNLWFAVGSKNAVQMLKVCIARCESEAVAGRSPLMSVEVDSEAWLALPEDDPVGLTRFLLNMDQAEPLLPFAYFIYGDLPYEPGLLFGPKPMPLLQKCIDLGGNHRMGMVVVSDRSGLKMDFELGEVNANYTVAQILRMIHNELGLNEAPDDEAPDDEDPDGEDRDD